MLLQDLELGWCDINTNNEQSNLLDLVGPVGIENDRIKGAFRPLTPLFSIICVSQSCSAEIGVRRSFRTLDGHINNISWYFLQNL